MYQPQQFIMKFKIKNAPKFNKIIFNSKSEDDNRVLLSNKK